MTKNSGRYANLIQRVFNKPLMIQERKLIEILEVIGPRLGIVEFKPSLMDDGDARESVPEVSHLDGILTMGGAEFEPRQEGHYVGHGVAVVPVIGSLVQRADYMDAMSGLVSYSNIEQMLSAAMHDSRVGEIVMEFDTRGGEVAGVFDAVDRIHELRGKGKKITAAVSEIAASAGYLLASATDEIVVPRTGTVGSIGVVAAHYDYSRAVEKKGIAITYVYAGDKKIDGNPFLPLSQNVKEEWQEEIDAIYKLFVDTVSRNTGLSVDKLRGTKAGMFTGFKAVESGLAHRVNSFANELGNALIRQQGLTGPIRLTYSQKEIEMNTQKEAQAKIEMDKAEAEAKVKAEADAKIKAEADAKAKAEADARAANASPAQLERARISGIIDCEEAKGREDMAKHLAYSTDMSVDEAKKLLAIAPTKANGNKLDKAMQNFQPRIPNAGANDDGEKIAATATTSDIYKTRASFFKGGAQKAA